MKFEVRHVASVISYLTVLSFVLSVDLLYYIILYLNCIRFKLRLFQVITGIDINFIFISR